MKKLIILLCILATAIIGYQISSALTISSGSISFETGGTLNEAATGDANTLLWDVSGDVIYWDSSDDSILWD